MNSLIVKRAMRVGDRKTSVSLEGEFWNTLKEIARGSSTTLSDLVSAINLNRGDYNLSSAIRVYVLLHYWPQSDRNAIPANHHLMGTPAPECLNRVPA